MSINDILESIAAFGWKYVCVTGGEPLYQENIDTLLDALVLKRYSVSLETNGAILLKNIPDAVSIILDIKCPSSTMQHMFLRENLKRISAKDEIKFVIANRDDFEYAVYMTTKEHLFAYTPSILCSPVHGLLDPKLLVEWMRQEKLPFRLNVQVHKYIWSPCTRGV